MSEYQIRQIMQITECDEKEARWLLRLMDGTNDHPDWSEDSDEKMKKHFRSVVANHEYMQEATRELKPFA